MARRSRSSDDYHGKMAVPSLEGDVKIVSSIGTFVLNTSTLEWRAFFIHNQEKQKQKKKQTITTTKTQELQQPKNGKKKSNNKEKLAY